MNKELRAFHGKQEVKDFYVARVRAHREADELVKGVYYEKGEDGKLRACGVGCTIHGNNHAAYETELGIPRVLARLEDGIFEALPNERAMAWPEQFLEAIPVGADLSKVFYRFMHWLLVDETDGVIRFANERTREPIQNIANLFALVINGGIVTEAQWREARSAAYAAAYDAAAAAAAAADAAAADAAAAAAAAYAAAAAAAADAAAYDAADAAAAYDAADAAAAYAAADAARSQARVQQSEELLELLHEA